jgi:hypothetical protein
MTLALSGLARTSSVVMNAAVSPMRLLCSKPQVDVSAPACVLIQINGGIALALPLRHGDNKSACARENPRQIYQPE